MSKLHIRDLHRTAAEAFEHDLGRVLGKDRAQEIIAERNARQAELRMYARYVNEERLTHIGRPRLSSPVGDVSRMKNRMMVFTEEEQWNRAR